MSAPSLDLVNADYTVGLLTSYRKGPFSGFLRLHHQSSHLGDELILNSRTPINRINLSFEEADLKLSYELTSWLRLYGGGGMLVGRDPNDLQRGTSQAGAELTSPWTIWDGKVRPVAYADVQANGRSNWRVASSVMAGLQFEDARIGDRSIYKYWRSISVAHHPTDNFSLTISNGSDLASTSESRLSIDSRPRRHEEGLR